MSNEKIKYVVDKIIDEIDKSTLMGAAYDCISDNGKIKFQNKLEKIIKDFDEKLD